MAAEEEELKTRDLDLEKIRLHNDRLSRARVRHNNALEKEMLSHVSRHMHENMFIFLRKHTEIYKYEFLIGILAKFQKKIFS